MLNVIKFLKSLTGHAYYMDTNEVCEMKRKVEHLLENDNILDKYGFKHGTDKVSVKTRPSNVKGIVKVVNGHDYLRHYEFLFQTFRTDRFTLLEFGCYKGDSLRMWEEYFPNAEIYGVDVDENTLQFAKGRIHIVIGDATSKDTYDTLIEKIDTHPRIILDDASHAWSDQRRSFELFWDMLEPGGFYIVEDLECGTLGSSPQYSPKIQDAQPFNEYMHDRCKILRWAPDRKPRENAYHFEHLPEHIQKIEMEMDACIFIPGAVIVKKKEMYNPF